MPGPEGRRLGFRVSISHLISSMTVCDCELLRANRRGVSCFIDRAFSGPIRSLQALIILIGQFLPYRRLYTPVAWFLQRRYAIVCVTGVKMYRLKLNWKGGVAEGPSRDKDLEKPVTFPSCETTVAMILQWIQDTGRVCH